LASFQIELPIFLAPLTTFPIADLGALAAILAKYRSEEELATGFVFAFALEELEDFLEEDLELPESPFCQSPESLDLLEASSQPWSIAYCLWSILLA